MARDASPDVAIIGGGVIGCACAWLLARAGCSVALYERGRIAGEASGAAAGILAPLAESHEAGPFATLAVAGLRAFAEEMPVLAEESGIDPQYRLTGVLRLALADGDIAPLRAAAAWQSTDVLGPRWVDADALARLEPALTQSRGALLSEREGQVRPALLTRALAAAAQRRGAQLHKFAEVAGPALTDDAGAPGGAPAAGARRVLGIRFQNGDLQPAGAVLLAGGAWSGALAGPAGDSVPVRPVKGQYAILSPVGAPLRRVVFGGAGYLVPRPDGTIYAGATMEEAGFDRRVTLDGLAAVLQIARSLAPGLAEAEVLATGAGLRPASRDGLPVLGAVPECAGLYVASGHFRNGVLLSLITARLLTSLLTKETPALSLAPFAPRLMRTVNGSGPMAGPGPTDEPATHGARVTETVPASPGTRPAMRS